MITSLVITSFGDIPEHGRLGHLCRSTVTSTTHIFVYSGVSIPLPSLWQVGPSGFHHTQLVEQFLTNKAKKFSIEIKWVALAWATLTQDKTTTKMSVHSTSSARTHFEASLLSHSKSHPQTNCQLSSPLWKVKFNDEFHLTILSLGTFNSKENND